MYLRKKIVVSNLFLFVVLEISQAQNPETTILEAQLDTLYQTGRFSGTCLVAYKDKIVWSKSWGYSDESQIQKISTTSSFNLASVSKQFVAFLVLRRIQKGEFNLDDPLSQFLPAFPYPSVTIRHLLQQCSGLPEYFDLFKNSRSPLDTLDNARLLQLLSEKYVPLSFTPGTNWEYCNTNYALLVILLEKMTSKSFETIFEEEISRPFGLSDTYVHRVHRPTQKPLVKGIRFNGEKTELNDLTYLDGVVGDGNIYSSASDLAKWEPYWRNNSVLGKELAASAYQTNVLPNGKLVNYGYAWFNDSINPTQHWHTGGWAGFGNLLFRDDARETTVILLSNGSNPHGLRAAQAWATQKTYSVPATELIADVLLADGTGIPLRKASVRIEGEKIIHVGQLTPFPHERITEGKGMLLAPGFIDTHSHLDGSLEAHPEALAALNQGITTIVVGQDGYSDPIDSMERSMEKKHVSINVATYTGHASLREKIMGKNRLDQTASTDEINQMQDLLKEDLQKGSMGLSTGLEYEGAFYSSREEVIALAKTAAAEKGRYISHLRSEDITMEEALQEIIEIGKEARLPVQISHIKIALKDDWKTASTILEKLQKARLEGIDITADCYPYDFWNSTLRVLYPLKDFDKREGAQFAVDHLFEPEGSVLLRFAPDTNYRGKTITAIARERKESEAATLQYLVTAAARYQKINPTASGVETIMGKSMHEADVAAFIAWPHTNICSDGANGGHPRGYGSFTKVLNHYVKETKLLSWESAIHKMTGLSAEHMGIKDRGLIAPDFYADLVLIDTEKVKDHASMANPQALSDGIVKVWVNGASVYENKHHLGRYPGKTVKRAAQ